MFICSFFLNKNEKTEDGSAKTDGTSIDEYNEEKHSTTTYEIHGTISNAI